MPAGAASPGDSVLATVATKPATGLVDVSLGCERDSTSGRRGFCHRTRAKTTAALTNTSAPFHSQLGHAKGGGDVVRVALRFDFFMSCSLGLNLVISLRPADAAPGRFPTLTTLPILTGRRPTMARGRADFSVSPGTQWYSLKIAVHVFDTNPTRKQGQRQTLLQFPRLRVGLVYVENP
jgi:hypothetical protein